MKYFLVEGEYLQPFAELGQLGALVDEHRTYIRNGYDNGDFMVSGPQIPPDSGVLMLRAQSREAVDDMMAREPFVRDGKVRILRVVEFRPAMFQASAREWFEQ